KTGNGDQQVVAHPDAVAEKAGQRHENARRHHVAGQYPADLLGARAELAFHMGQGDVDDGGVEQLHDGADHHHQGDDQPLLRRYRRHGVGAQRTHDSAARLVSMLTALLAPTRNGNPVELPVTRIFTGTRWVVLTQLPVAFSGGSRENAVPLAGLMLSTTPVNSWPGYISTSILACW